MNEEGFATGHNKGYSEFEWEIKESRSGVMTLLLGGRAVYSSYDPLKHAEDTARRLIENTFRDGCDQIIIIGLGLGYLPRALYEAGFRRMIIWDPFPVMQKSFPVCGGEWKEKVVVVHAYHEFKNASLRLAGKGSRPRLIIHPGYDIFCRLEHRLAARTLERIYNVRNYGPNIVSRRSLETMVRLPFLGTIDQFENAYEGRRAVLANPGPSLKHCVDALKSADDVIVFASLQSARYLQKNGIRVNYIVSADPKDMSPFTSECADDFDAFFAETSSDPGTLDWKREKTFLFHFKCGQAHEKLWMEAQLPVIDEPTSSVSEVMLLLADYMGFDEMYFLGMDFCWTEDRYTYRTEYKYDSDARVNDMASCFTLSASDGRLVTTQSLYYHGARFMQYKCAELKGRGRRLYQIEGGLKFIPEGIIAADELEKKLRSRKSGSEVHTINPRSLIGVEYIEHLLHEIESGRMKSRQTDAETAKTWPFLQGLPSSDLTAACGKYLNQLKSSHIRMSRPVPADADTLLEIGLSQVRSGDMRDAEETLRAVIKLRPDNAVAYSSLGNVLKRLEKHKEAVECHQRAVSLLPLSAEAISNLASAYLCWGDKERAVEEYLRAVSLMPASAELHYNLGTALQKSERYKAACDSFKSAIKLKPDHVYAHMNLGSSLKSLGQLREAIIYLRKAVGFAPDTAEVHWNLALALLLSGDYDEGMKEYEWRLKMPDIPIRKFPQPVWDGSVQKDKTLFVYAEQGMGDVIQFVRYCAEARKRVGRLILDCHAPLTGLFNGIKGVDQVVSSGEAFPMFDINVPLLSLPGVLGGTDLRVGHEIPYLKACPGAIQKWCDKIKSEKYTAGIVWAGNPGHEDDHNRSIKLSSFARLLKTPGVTFVSLQKEKPDPLSFEIIRDAGLIDAGPELKDFSDTAAIIDSLDLVISVDTAVAHLAGAMGKKVWLLIPFAPDWRWMLGRDDTPWYPTMRIFRQSRHGDWDGVIETVCQALKRQLTLSEIGQNN
ncbi:MAG: tetratricopeptide repeat protein [Nitrospirota bacterium]